METRKLVCNLTDLHVRIASNFCHSLTTKLPFEDDEFDHVHIQSIATGVPESKVRVDQFHDMHHIA